MRYLPLRFHSGGPRRSRLIDAVDAAIEKANEVAGNIGYLSTPARLGHAPALPCGPVAVVTLRGCGGSEQLSEVSRGHERPSYWLWCPRLEFIAGGKLAISMR